MKKVSRSNWKIQLAFGSAILTLLVVGAFSYRGMVLSSASDRWVSHSHEVLEHIHDLASAMENLESSYRGFALTGDRGQTSPIGCQQAGSFRPRVRHREPAGRR
jgi:CHASE3 domain sensor protein